MSDELEDLCESLFAQRIPNVWLNAPSYPSLKSLNGYISSLIKRLNMFKSWLNVQQPVCFWICGFFFTQSFLTGTLQNYARKHKLPIDTIGFDFDVLSEYTHSVFTENPDDGCFIHGLFMDGARWLVKENNFLNAHGAIEESLPRELYSPLPIIKLIPKAIKDIDAHQFLYQCPVYKTTERRGTLSTTGHSTNYVMMILLPIQTHHSQHHWVKRGVALICSVPFCDN